MSATPIKINKNQLKYIASDAGQPFVPGAELTFLTGETEKVSPTLTNGAIYFATKDDDNTDIIKINNIDVTVGYNRAYIFLDANNKRYAITGPVDWSEILNKPLTEILSNLTMASTGNLHNLQLRYLNNVNEVKSNLTLPFVLQTGDTMTGALTIARDNSSTSPRVSLDYNDITDSLDFTFT